MLFLLTVVVVVPKFCIWRVIFRLNMNITTSYYYYTKKFKLNIIFIWVMSDWKHGVRKSWLVRYFTLGDFDTDKPVVHYTSLFVWFDIFQNGFRAVNSLLVTRYILDEKKEELHDSPSLYFISWFLQDSVRRSHLFILTQEHLFHDSSKNLLVDLLQSRLTYLLMENHFWERSYISRSWAIKYNFNRIMDLFVSSE